MAWYKVASNDKPESSLIIKVRAGSTTICLVHEEGVLYALGNICPHAGADLSRGWCEQGKLMCPYHRYSYNLQNGKGSPGQNDFVKTYPVEMREDGVYVEVVSFLGTDC